MTEETKGAGKWYGYNHRRLRAQWVKILGERGQVPCARCGLPIINGEPFDLGHPRGEDVALGGDGTRSAPEHQRCNRSAGASLGNSLRSSTREAVAAAKRIHASRNWWAES